MSVPQFGSGPVGEPASPVRSAVGRVGRLARISVAGNRITLVVGTFHLANVSVRFGHRVGVDAAIFDRAVANDAHFRASDLLLKSVQPFRILGDHFSPAQILFAPAFRWFPSVFTLLVLQAVLFTVAVGIVAGTARR